MEAKKKGCVNGFPPFTKPKQANRTHNQNAHGCREDKGAVVDCPSNVSSGLLTVARILILDKLAESRKRRDKDTKTPMRLYWHQS